VGSHQIWRQGMGAMEPYSLYILVQLWNEKFILGDEEKSRISSTRTRQCSSNQNLNFLLLSMTL
jgi:hypothetical protein